MAKNTGRGSREEERDDNLWTRRPGSSGKFLDLKTQGGLFGGKRHWWQLRKGPTDDQR